MTMTSYVTSNYDFVKILNGLMANLLIMFLRLYIIVTIAKHEGQLRPSE